MVAPGSASSRSTVRTAFGVTRYCFPPVRITAKVICGLNWSRQDCEPGAAQPRRDRANGVQAVPCARESAALAQTRPPEGGAYRGADPLASIPGAESPGWRPWPAIALGGNTQA
ncbi:hypothetical protein GCM10011504_17900 [Siccirubricoccus deserti]|nr:hypothetical protein GCM10011504_17900 [Siccirubricoccus deserti]